MLSSNATNIWCPGCQPSDFPRQHICGIQNQAITPFLSGFQVAPPVPCDHCLCLKRKAGWYDVPAPTVTWPGRTERKYLKPHWVCCNCGNQQVKV